MEVEDPYMEDQNIVLPSIVDGPTAIGDLWDCHNSKLIGLNIFRKQLDSHHLQVNVLNELKYTLNHVRRVQDRHKLLKLSGDVSLELLAGLIKADGAEYDSGGQFSASEELLCYYDLKTFSVKALPSSKEVVDEAVMETILKGETKVTHVVMTTILGAEVKASILLRWMKSNGKENAGNNLFGKFPAGPISAATKTTLGKLDTKSGEDCEVKIEFYSKPVFYSQPVKISEMFQFIDWVGKMAEEEHPAFINMKDSDANSVFGVPLRFYLVPINHLFDTSVERVYVKIKDDVLERIMAIFATVMDLQNQGCLTKQIVKAEPRLGSVLADANNPLVVKLLKRETEIQTLAKQCHCIFTETLKEYKVGKVDQNHLIRIASATEKNINIIGILQEIQEFTSECVKELLVYDEIIDDGHQMRIFNNSMNMMEWYQTQNPIKVLLRTRGNYVNIAHVTRLCEISIFLKDLGIEVGVATPVASEGRYDLSLKISDLETTYCTGEMSFVVDILHMLVDHVDQTSTRLFTIYASLNGIKLPFQNHLMDLRSMIEILSEIKQIKIADSYTTLRELALEADGRWKFVMDLNALDSAAEAIVKFRCLNVQLSELAVDWIVGMFGFESPTEYSNAPLLFVFKDEKLEATCFDNVDILLLIEAFKPKGNHCLTLLYPDRKIIEKSCLHKSQADFALKVAHLFQYKYNSLKSEPKLSEIETFSSTINKKVEAVQILIRSFLGNDEISLWRAMAIILLHDFPEAKTIFKSHTWIDEVNGCPAGVKSINPKHLADELMEFLSTQDAFYANLQVAIRSVSYFPSLQLQPDALEECINNLTSDPNCCKKLREQLIACQEIKHNLSRIENVHKILKKHIKTADRSKYEAISLYIQLLDIPVKHLGHFFSSELLPKLIAWLAIDESNYPNLHSKLLQLVDACYYYVMLPVLAQMNYVENHVFLICTQLESLTSTVDIESLCQVLGKVTVDKLSEYHYQWLFANPKLCFLLETNSSCSRLLQTIKVFHCQKSKIANYIPSFLRERIQAILEEEVLLECSDVIQNSDHAISMFQKIASQKYVPDNFGKVLGESVRTSKELKTSLKNANALFFWAEERQLFTETWNCETVTEALDLLIEWRHNLDRMEGDDKLNAVAFNIHLPQSNSQLQNNLEEELVGSSRTTVSTRLLGADLNIIGLRNFLEIQSILNEPQLGSVFEDGFITKLLPYIVQRLKMWGIHVIQQENLAKLNTSQISIPKGRCFKKFKFDEDTISDTISQTPSDSSVNSNTSCSIARIDVLACLNAVCHCVVFQDLLRVMSQFPVALPLVLHDLCDAQWDYVYLMSLLKNISVKWEVRSGVVVHNQLFINPFKMIVALRVGATSSGCSGKSTVLNQILGNKHMFSSLGGPGADKGIPMTLHGSVELAILLQETCSYALWESVVKNHYLLGSNEVLMLVNMHGDVLELRQTVELLKKMASSFIAFFMPCTKLELQARSRTLEDILGDTADVVYILVDPIPECKGQPTNTISTNQLTLDNTLETVRAALEAAINSGGPKTLIPLTNICSRVRPSPNVFTEESELLIAHVKKLGCKKARSILQLQKVNPKYTTNYPALVMTVWQKEEMFQSLIETFIQVLNIPLKCRLLAFAHLDRELSLMTENESKQIRKKLSKFQEQRRRLLDLQSGYTISTEQKKITEQIRHTMDELDGMSLGLEHLYREVGRMYEATQCNDNCVNEPILSLPRQYAELLISGHAIEILDGDIGDMCGPWLNSICHCVCESYPDLRIFTLSIIGLQSSGKSTLLNALFACKFAVSVGRCTRGLFMRLLFLDESLKGDLNIDAILLIDTEGLGAPEKLNDPEAEHKDRLLATFAMSVSNLSLINVLGESIRDLTDILQIVIITMARLEKADIKPDILMVQHLSERDTSKTMKGADEFCKALEEAVRLTDSKDMAIGVRNSNSLRKLENRVKNGQLLKQFRSFKNGASANAPPSQEYHEDVVDLYKTILNSCKKVTSPQKFHNWHELIQNYWAAVSTQDFSLRFKNIKEVQEFIDRGSAIAKVKQALDAAFRIHKETCETKLRKTVNELANNTKRIQNWEKIKENELQNMTEVLKGIPNSCETACSKCSEAMHLKNQLFTDLEGKNFQQETEATIHSYIQKTREGVIRYLNQTAEAIQVKHGWSCEFDAIIENILMEKLEVARYLSERERQNMVDAVWSRVEQQISGKQQVASAKRRIFDEVKVEYSHANEVLKYFCKERNLEHFPDLACTKAIEFTGVTWLFHALRDTVSSQKQHSHLDFKQIDFLKSKLDELPNLVLKKCETEHFDGGMVRNMKTDIDKVLHELEDIHIQNGKLLPKFKWTVHIYTILKFVEVMTLKEEEWNKNNNPYCILLLNEDTYRKTIYIRLKHGFGFEAEGWIIGELLLKAIKKRGQKQGDRAYIDYVRSMSWLTSSENVRLTYFAKLAKQVEEGDKEQALAHFRHPKTAIEAWFKHKVDSVYSHIGRRKFIETVDSELKYVEQEVRNQKSGQEMKAFIRSYLAQVEDMKYNPGVDLDSHSSTEFEFLRKPVLLKLEEDKNWPKLGITLVKPSTHTDVKSLLGCTEHCYWCGSLCWGQAGHAENFDNTQKHHACHQPEGLIGVSHKNKHYLFSNSCDSTGDSWITYWTNCREGMTWKETKSHQDFVNWTFSPHHKTEFNDLMKWFFLQLHKDISNSYNLLPAPNHDLSTNGFFNVVSLDHILATIKSRI